MNRLTFLIAAALATVTLACNLPLQAESSVLSATEDTVSGVVPSETAVPSTTPDRETPEVSPTVNSSVAVPGGDQIEGENTEEGSGPILGEAVYETRFLNGWPEITTEHGRSRIVNGVYRIEVGADWAHWVFTSQATESVFYAEVTATLVSCPTNDGAFGIIFQYESSTAFRFLVVSCDNQYILGERAGTRNQAISSGSLPDGSNIATGEHTIGVWARDMTISGYVDGQFMASAAFETMPAGDIGPYAETGEEGITVDFSRLAVYNIGEQ